MKIMQSGFLICIFLFTAYAFAGEGVSKTTIDQYRQAKDAVEKLADTKTGKLSRDIIENVKAGIFKAQQAIESGDEKTAKQSIEMANLQMTLAEATAGEREATDRTAVSRTELKRLEQRLENILTGKGDLK